MRSYTAQNIIALPRLNTAAAVALGQGLITAAHAQPTLPALISTRLGALTATHAALHQALSNRPQTDTDPQRIRLADRAEDVAWTALHDWLLGWSRLSTPEAAQANTMHAVLFPTGLKFIRLPYKLEWAEADAKLARITSEGFDIEIQKLGGQVILDQLKAAHQAYGEALGITAEGQDSTINLREPLEAFTKTLRAYVLAVSAHEDPEDPPSIDLTDALLAPIQKWEGYINATPAQPEPMPPVATTPATPTTASPTQPAPTQPAPTQSVPTQGAPTQSVPTQATPTPVMQPAAAPVPSNGPGVETVHH